MRDSTDITLPAPPLARLSAERRLRFGAVPAHLPDAIVVRRDYEISPDAFLFRVSDTLAFHYRRGEGTVCAHGPGVGRSEIGLFFDGSVYGAIAWLNGFVPLHASSIVHDGIVHAFTGASGEGKSTLATALGRRGFAIMSDDVLLLDLSGGAVVALPGHARVKLWWDGVVLTATAPTDRVRPDIDKFYVSDGLRFATDPLPLGRLYWLESGAGIEIAERAGLSAVDPLRKAMYRPELQRALISRADQFATVSRLLDTAGLRRFVRPRDPNAFETSLDRLVRDITG